MKNPAGKLTATVLIATAVFGGFLIGEHPKHCQSVVMRDLQAHYEFEERIKGQVNPNFEKAMVR